jgi:hypothetical protein
MLMERVTSDCPPFLVVSAFECLFEFFLKSYSTSSYLVLAELNVLRYLWFAQTLSWTSNLSGANFLEQFEHATLLSIEFDA